MKYTGITGATGFVGEVLCKALIANGKVPRRFLRRIAQDCAATDVVVGNIGPGTDWRLALADVDCVIHLAARTHVLDDDAADPLAAYRRINVDATRNLAQQAAAAGVRRFIFMSSIKVHGEATPDLPYTESDVPAPLDAYGISKLEAESLLRDITRHSAMELVILRPPLIYGPGVKGNFLRLMRIIDRGLPLPLASVRNRRSLIHVANLADIIVDCIDTPAAAGQTFLVSDGEDLSTADLIRRLAAAMNKPARLLPCPIALLQLGAAIFRQRGAVARLTDSLTIDATHLHDTLNWTPRILLDQGLIDTARWYYQARIQPGN